MHQVEESATTTTTPPFDKQDQYQRIKESLLAAETISAVFDCIGVGTGFIGLTDKRVILQDNSFVGKKVALTSIPYSRVQAVSFVTNKSMMGKWASSGEISIRVGGKEHECEFRGHEKAKFVHDMILFHLLAR